MSDISPDPAWEKERFYAELKFRQEELDLRKSQAAEETKFKDKEVYGVWKGVERGLTITIPLLTILIPAYFSYRQFLYTEENKAKAQIKADLDKAVEKLHTERAKAKADAEKARLERTTALIKAKSAFAARQITLFERAVKVTGDLMITSPGTVENQAARQQFKLLYWSQLPLVETPEVTIAMIDLHDALEKHKTDISAEVLDVSDAIRKSLKDIYEPDSTTKEIIPAPEAPGAKSGAAPNSNP